MSPKVMKKSTFDEINNSLSELEKTDDKKSKKVRLSIIASQSIDGFNLRNKNNTSQLRKNK